MSTIQTLRIKGERFVVIPQQEYSRLRRKADKVADEGPLPPLPRADANGYMPALEFADAALARSVIRDRRDAGLTQAELAKLAGVRTETVSRIETGKHSPTLRTVEKIDRALKKAGRKK